MNSSTDDQFLTVEVQQPANCGPLVDPNPMKVGDRQFFSSGSMEIIGGATDIGCWSAPETAVEFERKVLLKLSPDCPAVIGRSDGPRPPYLDPTYCPTRIVPGTDQSVVQSSSMGPDVNVSRAHFMLRGNAQGIMLTNGVPRLGGGIRPPMNGTWIVAPEWRCMEPGEDYQIEHGAAVSIHLPNRVVVRICAD